MKTKVLATALTKSPLQSWLYAVIYAFNLTVKLLH